MKDFALSGFLLTFWHPLDPFSYYGRFQMRTGIKFYPKNKRFYIEPMILGSYGSFKHGDVYRPIDTDAWHYDVNRIKKEVEGMIKIGWTEQVKHKFRDGYIGLGYRKRWINDVVFSDHYRDSQIDKHYNIDNPNHIYPYSVEDSFSRITVHIGLQLGYCK